MNRLYTTLQGFIKMGPIITILINYGFDLSQRFYGKKHLRQKIERKMYSKM